MSNDPFLLDVREPLVSVGAPHHVTTSGAAPVRLGGEMLGVAEGAPVEVVADITNLGESLLVDATAYAQVSGQCSRCLSEISQDVSLHVSDVFGTTPDFISGDDAEDGDEPHMVQDDRVDITQLLVDEAGLNLPFNPVCEDYGQSCSDATPAPDGVSGEEEVIDPRWAALADKFPGAGQDTPSDSGEDA
ncbi:YceD family protein [Corynebacterium sp.]|uniref:YceD family protein n=1 Tax=Corynebacterium sp. TaxID=1720 RepID=UPI0028A85E3D|nr:YceD family protein [Corynebacterium sp.]